ncbi:MAG: peptidylprolyl isomerase [Bacteroidales bacterium]
MRISIPALLTAAMLSITSCGNREEVVISTGQGDIHVTLDLKNAPVTSANFLRYVDAHLFDSSCFYRVVRLITSRMTLSALR